jgi:hypothetical protein
MITFAFAKIIVMTQYLQVFDVVDTKKIRLPHGTLISRLLLVEYLFCLYWKVTYEKVFCLPFCWCCFVDVRFLS